MDMLDQILNKSPKEKFFEIIKHGNLNAIENAFDEFFDDYIAMIELLEKQNLNYEDVKNYKINNIDFINDRKNDVFIELGAKILGQEG